MKTPANKSFLHSAGLAAVSARVNSIVVPIKAGPEYSAGSDSTIKSYAKNIKVLEVFL